MENGPFAALPNLLPTCAHRSGAVFDRLLLTLLATLLSACASTRIPQANVTQSDPEALALVTASQRAHGVESFSTIRDLNTHSSSTWSWLGPRLHSVVSDRKYVRDSEIAYDLAGGTIVELHKAKRGRKFVFRGAGRMALWYNGQSDSREEAIRAAALTADTGKMSVLGPLFFQRPGVTLEKLRDTDKVDGAECDQVLAVLRPGFGYADEDRVVLSIDQKTQRLRRAAFTMNGLLEKNPGAMDVTYSGWAERNGVWWATDYQERFLGWMKLATRHWKLLDVKANHGFAPKAPELLGEALSEAVAR